VRALHVFKRYLPHRGGIVTAIEVFAQGQPPPVRARVLACQAAGMPWSGEIGGVPVHLCGSLGLLLATPFAPGFPFAFWRACEQADVVHYHLPFPLIDVASAMRPPSAPVIVHWHSDVVRQKRTGAMLEPLFRKTLDRADVVIASHESVIEQSPLLGGYRNKIELIPYGVVLSQWDTLPDAERALIAPFRWSDRPLALFSGRLVYYKGAEPLLEALATTPGLDLAMIGEGALRAKLAARVAQLGLSDRVRFFGEVPHAALRAAYHACDFLAFPSTHRSETFGISQIEAMACGKPVINTSLPTAVSSVARDEQEGLTVTPGDVAALAAALARMRDDPELRARLGAAARARAVAEYASTSVNAKIAALYARLVPGFKPGAAVVEERLATEPDVIRVERPRRGRIRPRPSGVTP
jgi:rhamnosyl/mannosyltransferase